MDFLVSAVVHGFLLAAVILIPLFFTQAMDIHEFTATLLVAPPHAPAPPPPPAPVAVARSVAVRKAMLPTPNTLVIPKAIPKHVNETPAEADAMPEFVPGGGVPGGVTGGIPGGVIGGVLGGAPSDIAPPPLPAAAPKGPIRVGGEVKAPRIISRVEPVYPILAKQARVSGDVVIEAVIDTQGNVVEMHAVAGPPLLIPAAIEALRHWKYEPTILGGQPYPVRLTVTITFRLH
jgi:protein TonB